MRREEYCMKLSKGLTEFYGKKIDFMDVLDQLLLIEHGIEPTDEVIATWIRKTATLKK